MKEVIVTDIEVKLTAKDLDLLETKLETKLPNDYKRFLLAHNGGHPEKDCFDFLESENGSNVAWFYAFYEGEHSNLLKEFSRFKDRIPDGFLPIARDSCSNLICLCISGPEYGRVYFWEFDYAVPYGEEPTFDNMYLLANNFTDFINGLFKFVDLKKDDNGKEIWIHSHDKYSLPFSTHVKKYGKILTEFFAKAPPEVEDYVIEEYEANKDVVLYYDVKRENKRYKRIIQADHQIIDSEGAILDQ